MSFETDQIEFESEICLKTASLLICNKSQRFADIKFPTF